MMGRFVDTVTSCQRRCTESRAYDFQGSQQLANMIAPDRPDLLLTDQACGELLQVQHEH